MTNVTNPKVELWAKKYMSSLSYEHVGTLTTWKLFKSVMKPMPTSTEETNTRNERADAALDKLEKLTKGNVKQQFSPERLADAIAICKKDWAHFANSSGTAPKKRLWLPTQLALDMMTHTTSPEQLWHI